jgi:probable HAF family extracellular repeat protein
MKDLGHLGGGTSLATAINNNGVVVGHSTLINGGTHAFRWTQSDGMVDLNSLLPSGSGWFCRTHGMSMITVRSQDTACTITPSMHFDITLRTRQHFVTKPEVKEGRLA